MKVSLPIVTCFHSPCCKVNEIKSKTVGPQLTESIELAIMSEEFTEDSKTRLLDLKLQLDIPDKLYEEACKVCQLVVCKQVWYSQSAIYCLLT